jgi:hypothetical protein
MRGKTVVLKISLLDNLDWKSRGYRDDLRKIGGKLWISADTGFNCCQLWKP